MKYESVDKWYPPLGDMMLNTDYAINRDKLNFSKWENGEITLQTCWTRFKKTNKIPAHKYRYNEEWFEAFLNGMGYYRGGGDGRED